MLCADVQRALSDGDGRVLRGRRMRAHVRSCRACRQFKTALAQRPADLAALAPALPPTVGAALLAHLLPGAKATLASGAGAGAGGGVVATVATKAAIVAVATVTIAGTGTVVRNNVTARDPAPRPAATAPATSGTRPASAPAAAHPATAGRLSGSADRDHGRSPAGADRHPSGPSHSAQAKVLPAAGAQAATQRPGAKGQAIAQAKQHAAASNGRRAEPKRAKGRPARPATGRPTTAPLPKAHPAHLEHPATPATPGAHAEPAATQDPGRPADTTPPGDPGAAHPAK
jgi:hypothetical protein